MILMAHTLYTLDDSQVLDTVLYFFFTSDIKLYDAVRKIRIYLEIITR